MKELLSYALAIVGFGMVLSAFLPIYGRLRYLAAKPMILHLLRTQPNQAEIVMRSGKRTVLEALAAAMKTAAMMQTDDASIIVGATKPAYDAGAVVVKLGWDQTMRRAKLGGAAAIGAIALAVSVGAWLPIPIVFAVFSALVFLAVWGFKLDVERSLVLARAELLPAVEAAFIERRYRLP